MFKVSKNCAAAALVYAVAMPSYADLQALIDDGAFNTLEEQAATATLLTYERLLDAGCDDAASQPPIGSDQAGCTGATFTVFSNVRELIHTANEISGAGPTAFSLGYGSDVEALGFALRWTAAEEYAAQGNMSGEFVGGQISGLATRLTALRAGASGFNVLGLGSSWQQSEGQELAYGNRPLGAGASGDGDNYGRLGGFINYDFGDGTRSSSVLEDAFSFDNSQITLGLDYRLGSDWVVGVIVGLSDQELEFDPSQSIVEGGMSSEGTSFQPFAMYQQGNWYVSASLGFQKMSFDTRRAIIYASFNPNTSDVDTVAVSSTDADMRSLFVETGYTFRWQKFSLEPYANLKNSDTSIDGFVERDITDDAFDLAIGGQDISSNEFTFGTKLQCVLTPSFGVFIPYLALESVHQSDDAARIIEATYANDSSGDIAFRVPTEELDSAYSVYTIGVSSVLRGGRQSKAGGSVGGDIQAFASYRSLHGLRGFDIDFYSLGLRYTF